MLNTTTQDLKANTSSNGKSILAVTADTVNPNGGFLIGISQPSIPNPIVFGHDKTAFVEEAMGGKTASSYS